MVMDEKGRNGRNWHLAQQITELVIKPHIMQLSMTTTSTTCNQTKTTNHTTRNVIYYISNYNNLQLINK